MPSKSWLSGEVIVRLPDRSTRVTIRCFVELLPKVESVGSMSSIEYVPASRPVVSNSAENEPSCCTMIVFLPTSLFPGLRTYKMISVLNPGSSEGLGSPPTIVVPVTSSGSPTYTVCGALIATYAADAVLTSIIATMSVSHAILFIPVHQRI